MKNSHRAPPELAKATASELPIFMPLPDRRPDRNLAAFIRMARHELTTLGEDFDWLAWRWKSVGMFLKLGAPNSVGDPTPWHMQPQFVDFAKAYVRYQITHNPQSRLGKELLMALRVVEHALIKLTGTTSATAIDLRILNEAAQIARVHYSTGSAWKAGHQLEILARFLSKICVTHNDTASWVNPNPHDEIHNSNLDEDARKRRMARMPDLRAINALGQVFASGFDLSNIRTHADVYVTSLSAMLMAAPSRVGEVHELVANLEVEEIDSHGDPQYGWRFRSYKNKSQSWRIKWVPADWVPIAKEAIRRIREITEEPRAFARYVEDQLAARKHDPSAPLRFYRHPACPDVPDDQPLTTAEVAAALGISPIRPHIGVRATGLSGANGTYTLNSLWLWVLELLPAGFPYVVSAKNRRLKYSEALFCMHRYQMKIGATIDPVSVWIPTPNTISHRLANSKRKHGFFERHGFWDDYANPLRLTSHQFRHLLNTIAHEGTGESFLGAEAINFWSGRDRMWQGVTYDHEPVENKVRRATDALKRDDGSYAVLNIESATSGRTIETPSVHWQVMRPVPHSCADTELVHRSPVLWTFYGGCEHDWLLEPCQHHKDCLNCQEYFCIKGIGADDVERLDRLRKLLPRIIEQQERAKVLAERGDPGTQDWYESQAAYRQRIEQLISLLENPDIPVGSRVRLANSTANSHLHRVLKQVALQSLETGAERQDVVEALLLAFNENKGILLQSDAYGIKEKNGKKPRLS